MIDTKMRYLCLTKNEANASGNWVSGQLLRLQRLTDGSVTGNNRGPHSFGEVSSRKRLPHFDSLLRHHYCRLARCRSRIARDHPAHCADISALDCHRAWSSPVWLEQMGGAALFCLLAAVDDGYLAVSARLGSDRLWYFLPYRNCHDRDRWAGRNGRNH